jgi:hypothetical protein
VKQTSDVGLGQSSAVGIGGDPIKGTEHLDVLEMFLADDETQAIMSYAADEPGRTRAGSEPVAAVGLERRDSGGAVAPAFGGLLHRMTVQRDAALLDQERARLRLPEHPGIVQRKRGVRVGRDPRALIRATAREKK